MYLLFTVGYLLVVAVITLVLCVQGISVWIEVILKSITMKEYLLALRKEQSKRETLIQRKP